MLDEKPWGKLKLSSLVCIPPLHFETPALWPRYRAIYLLIPSYPMARSSTSIALVFTDSASDAYPILAAGDLPEAEWVFLDADRDGIEQITQVLADRSGLQSLHIIFSGSPSNLKLGSAHLTLFNLDRYGWQLQQWGEALRPNATILLYVANNAASNGAVVSLSVPFLIRLGLLTGANITPSRHLLSNVATANVATAGLEQQRTFNFGNQLWRMEYRV